jgi:hypothetical protein
LEERFQFEKQSAYGTIILKWIFKEQVWGNVGWIHVAQGRDG